MRYFLIALMSVVVLRAEYSIPSTNRTDWYNYAGVPGGIPFYTAGSPLTLSGANGAANLTTLQNAVNAAEDTDAAVLLPSGTYPLTGDLVMKNRVVLRGNGSSNTIINLNGQIQFHGGLGWVQKTVSSGSTYGSSQIVVSDSVGSDITTGSVIWIDQLNDPLFVSEIGWESDIGDAFTPGDYPRQDFSADGGTRVMGQSVTVTSISGGTTINFTPPLQWHYSLTPRVLYMANDTATNNTRSWAGIENMQINNSASPDTTMVNFEGAAWCWVSNVVFTVHGEEVAAVKTYASHQNTIEHCAFKSGGGQTDAMGFYNYVRTGWTHFNNNIAVSMKTFMSRAGIGTGSAYTYNTAVMNTNAGTQLIGDWYACHGAHPFMELHEGNVFWRYHSDSIHGTASHGTLWRNWIRGRDTWNTFGQGVVWLDSTNYFHHVIGTVAWYSGVVQGGYGYNWKQNSPTTFENENTTFRFGYSGYNERNDTSNESKQTIHGTYDYLSGTNSVVYLSGADTDIPASAMYPSKPAFFGDRPWPPFEVEDIPGGTNPHITNSPSGYRYVYLTDPPAESGGGSSGGGTVNVNALRIGTIQVAP